MPELPIVNPGLVLAHARAWKGTPHRRGAALRGHGADCVGLLRGIGAELACARVELAGWRDDWADVGAVAEGLAGHMVGLPPDAGRPGIVAAYRIGLRRVAHVGVLSDGCAMVHAADYGLGGRVREDAWGIVRGRVVSSLWGYRLPEGCEPGPDGITPEDCVAVVHGMPDGRAFAEIVLMMDATPLARSAPMASPAEVLAMLEPIYPFIEAVE